MMKAIPGDPLTSERSVSEEIEQQLRAYYGLDEPLFIQYVKYLKSVATWDFGPSMKYKAQTVNDIINDGFPVSALLGLEALFLAIGMGIILGVIAAMFHNKVPDYISMILAVIGMSVPNFLLAALFQYYFSLKLGILPTAGWGDSFEQTILPAFALAALPTAVIARLTRSNMLEVLQQDYMKTAKAKGLSRLVSTFKHALRNALLPVITYLGPLIAGVVTGGFVVEKIFGIPGLGMQFVTSINNRDYPLIMGTTVFYSIILLVMVLIVDLLYGVIDPRIKVSGKGKGGE